MTRQIIVLSVQHRQLRATAIFQIICKSQLKEDPNLPNTCESCNLPHSEHLLKDCATHNTSTSCQHRLKLLEVSLRGCFTPVLMTFPTTLRALLVVLSCFVILSSSLSLASLGTRMADSASKQTCSPADSCSDDSELPTVSELLSQPSETIVQVLGGIYEHSSWVAESFVQQTEKSHISTVTQLAHQLKGIVDASTQDQKLALLNAHPDLCEKVETMKELTSESQEEQSRAGLQSMDASEMAAFKQNNAAYKTKFGFPFILAVRNASKHTVLSALEGRLTHSQPQELATAIEQVHKIAWMRLLSKVNTDNAEGFLTCHGEWARVLFFPIVCCQIRHREKRSVLSCNSHRHYFSLH